MTKKAKSLIVLLPAICVLVAMIIPHFVRVRVTKAKPACISQLRQIQFAKTFWAQEQRKTTNDTPTWDDLRPHFRDGPAPLRCPDGGAYTIGRIGESPTCSIAEHTEYLRRHYP